MTEEGEFKKRFDIEGLVIVSDSPEEYDYSRQDGLRAYQDAIPKEFYTMKKPAEKAQILKSAQQRWLQLIRIASHHRNVKS